jgi:signal peptidase I
VFYIILLSLIVLSLVVMLVCRFIFPEISKREEEPWYLDFSRSFFPVLLLVFLLRGFVAEPFRIPSGSMLPTLELGDFILVNKYSYGLRLPITNTKILEIGEPERGDVVVFRFPPEPTSNYIKRLIGLPGDVIEYRRQTLFVNGKKIETIKTDDYIQEGKSESQYQFTQFLPIGDADGDYVSASLLIRKKSHPNSNAGRWVVPEGHYFMMGDNRDNSHDSRSRSFTFVPDENIVGKALFVWMSWNLGSGGGFDFQRFGASISADKVESE